MIAFDAVSVQAWPTMAEEFKDRRILRSYFPQGSAQGVRVIKIPPEWTWQVEPVKRILECLSLPDNWNSYGGHSSSYDAALVAIDFLSVVPFDNPPRPRVVPLPSGGIQLEWSKGQRELDVEFRPDGSIVFLKVQGDSEGEEGKLASFTSTHVNSLVSWLVTR